MITPQEIEIKVFDKVLFGGYRVSDVQEFVALVLKDYEELYKENAVLKNKIGVLVDKIEEYKELETSLRNALLSAQKMGESMIKEAGTRSEFMLTEAQIKAERLLNNVNMQIFKEKQHYEVLDEMVQLLQNAEQWVESAEFGIRKDY